MPEPQIPDPHLISQSSNPTQTRLSTHIPPGALPHLFGGLEAYVPSGHETQALALRMTWRARCLSWQGLSPFASPSLP